MKKLQKKKAKKNKKKTRMILMMMSSTIDHIIGQTSTEKIKKATRSLM